MKVLITGATGFLGKHLCAQLKQKGLDVTCLGSKDADLTHPDALNAFNDVQFDQIFHLAAWTQAGNFCLLHPGEQWIHNQRMNTYVLSWWHEHQPQAKMIAMGTSCSYDPHLPLIEENYLKGEPISDLFVYAMTKRMMFTGLRSFAQQFHHQYLHLIPSTLYGPGYHSDQRQMHFIFDLIRKILMAKRTGEPPVLWGDGFQKREIIYVEDFVKILLNLNDHYSNETFNIGYGSEFTIRQFAEWICKQVDFDPNLIQYDLTKYVGAKSKCLNIEKLKHSGFFKNMRSMESGLELVINDCSNGMLQSLMKSSDQSLIEKNGP